jgi:hypothetical protein
MGSISAHVYLALLPCFGHGWLEFGAAVFWAHNAAALILQKPSPQRVFFFFS